MSLIKAGIGFGLAGIIGAGIVNCSTTEERNSPGHIYKELIHDADNKPYRINFFCQDNKENCYRKENIIAIHQYPFESYGSSLEASFVLNEEKCEVIPMTYCYHLTEELKVAALENFLASKRMKEAIHDAKTY
ncbi:MAG: hypothetical protein Q8R18_02265 [bacterium]|nr:hypothetical protein [bacterium]